MRPPSDPVPALRALLAAIPDDRLREVTLEILVAILAAPPEAIAVPPVLARIHRGVPRKAATATKRSRAQLDKINARRKAARAAAKGNGSGNGAAITPAAVWSHAEKFQPKAPWRAIVREFGINEALAQDAHRNHTLPPGFGPEAAARFMEMRPAG
jgi:hypothetical protein